MRKTKIVATVGPSCLGAEKVWNMIQAGVNVFRLNFSHGSHAEHAQTIQTIRQVAQEKQIIVGILADLQGPKLRIGEMADGTTLETGKTFSLDQMPAIGNGTRAFFPMGNVVAKSIQPNDQILVSDGKIRLRVTAVTPTSIQTVVEVGGTLASRQGVNLPDVLLPLKACTEKDQADVAFLMTQPIDWLGLSFVQKAEDIEHVRNLLTRPIPIVAKIEKPQALKDLEAIVDQADGIMIARGDLGVECTPESVPVLQRKIVRAARLKGKPVIVATQMLESMIQNPVPTRAEASDVATAVYAGVDAVMLSGESAVGLYPVESVEMLDKIIRSVEKDALYSETIHWFSSGTAMCSTSDGVAASAKKMAESLKAAVVVTYTATGGTALRVAQTRPETPIFALTNQQGVCEMLNLVWGVNPQKIETLQQLDEMIALAKKICLTKKIAHGGQLFVLTCGVPFGRPGTTNIVCVESV